MGEGNDIHNIYIHVVNAQLGIWSLYSHWQNIESVNYMYMYVLCTVEGECNATHKPLSSTVLISQLTVMTIIRTHYNGHYLE